MSARETVLLTGFPGFIASRLLQRLAREPIDFLLLIQPHLIDVARTQLQEISAATGRSLNEFGMLQGDITQENLGLEGEDLATATQETTIIFHLAALYDLAVPRDIAMRVNVEGTKNVNTLARSLINLRHYHYISTCYVAGKREGRILETQLDHEAGFRNYYEETKYLAEIEVENLKAELPVTIHRPAVVCGDSHTGETAKYDGIYYLVHYLLRWPAGLSLLNIGNSVVSLNLVPVDFVVDALASLACDPQVIGKTLQLADPYPLTTEELFDTISRCIKGRGSLLTLPAGLVEFTLMLPGAPVVTHLPHHAVPYFFLKQTYDTIESTRVLSSHDVLCPSFPSYVDRIVNFARRHPVLN